MGCVGFRYGVTWDEVDVEFSPADGDRYGAVFAYFVGDVD